MIDLRPVRELDEWIQATFVKNKPIKISGGFRGTYSLGSSTQELFELGDRSATTVRILVTNDAPVEPDNPDNDCFNNDGSKYWWSTWAKVMTDIALISPNIDPVRLADILREDCRIRFFCDTNALCTGIAAWLLTVLDGSADIVTSSVVERELAAWPDRFNDFWVAKRLEIWHYRTQHRLAHRLTITPPPGVVMDRLSAEQDALMLAKFREEVSQRRSSDADMLLIELCRELIQDQPRNARVLFLTGDRDNARAATSALGAKNVLYAIADDNRARSMAGKVVVRGWWNDDGPLGAVQAATPGRFLWDILTACDFITLESNGNLYTIQQEFAVPRGVPSDWADPWLRICDFSLSDIIQRSSTQESVESSISENGEIKHAQLTEYKSLVENDDVKIETTEIKDLESKIDESSVQQWLLPPVVIMGDSLSISRSLRTVPKYYFNLLRQALWNGNIDEQFDRSEEKKKEAIRLLTALGAITQDIKPGPRADEYRQAWRKNDLDWYHADLLRHPGYRTTMSQLSDGPLISPDRRQSDFIHMARILGQAAKFSVRDAILSGDAPLEKDTLIKALYRWMASPGNAIETNTLCWLAISELKITPVRLEIALQRLWELQPDLPFEGQTGGTVDPGFAENIIEFYDDEYHFISVAPGALSFGRSGPVRFIARTS